MWVEGSMSAASVRSLHMYSELSVLHYRDCGGPYCLSVSVCGEGCGGES